MLSLARSSEVVLLVLVAGVWLGPAQVAFADIVPSPPPRPPALRCETGQRPVWHYEGDRWLCLDLDCESDADCPGEERCEEACDFGSCFSRCVYARRPRRAAFRHGSACAAAPARGSDESTGALAALALLVAMRRRRASFARRVRDDQRPS
jgi:hypothetical protein